MEKRRAGTEADLALQGNQINSKSGAASVVENRDGGNQYEASVLKVARPGEVTNGASGQRAAQARTGLKEGTRELNSSVKV